MLSPRLIRKLEALTDEAQAQIEAQADFLLRIPSQCHAHGRLLRRDLHLIIDRTRLYRMPLKALSARRAIAKVRR